MCLHVADVCVQVCAKGKKPSMEKKRNHNENYNCKTPGSSFRCQNTFIRRTIEHG